ncbi:uncharacterized protein LOC115043728 isoform X5 [Echeneis naucrates]|uniref:uncharacterized protein LOC115043728 isoform X5 n=1 Tax=Echeneis naucrates TaxID=173247 RepID=UPI0011140B52|nr:uncharacterized protein LOC115043728 isoform X5 [Echeneis naucrates]
MKGFSRKCVCCCRFVLLWENLTLEVMGATWISWRATVAVTVVFLQIRGPICATIRTVTGVEGQTLSFTCEYPPDFKNNEKTAENLMHYTTVMSSSPKDFIVDKLHMPLFLTAVMCVAALLFVCLFTLGLLWAVKQQGSSQHENRKTSSSDYESVTPMAGTEPEHNCAHLSPAPPPPPDFCPHFTSKYRESIVSLSLGDYVDVDVPGHMTQYQHLDLSQLEEHVYYSLSGNHSPKDEHVAAKQQTSH